MLVEEDPEAITTPASATPDAIEEDEIEAFTEAVDIEDVDIVSNLVDRTQVMIKVL